MNTTTEGEMGLRNNVNKDLTMASVTSCIEYTVFANQLKKST